LKTWPVHWDANAALQTNIAVRLEVETIYGDWLPLLPTTDMPSRHEAPIYVAAT